MRYRFVPLDVALPPSMRPCGGMQQPGQRQQSVGNSSSSAPYISTDPGQRRTHSSPSVLLLAPSVRHPSSHVCTSGCVQSRLRLRLRRSQASSRTGGRQPALPADQRSITGRIVTAVQPVLVSLAGGLIRCVRCVPSWR